MKEEIKNSRSITKFFQLIDSQNSICGYNEPLTYYQKNKQARSEYQKKYIQRPEVKEMKANWKRLNPTKQVVYNKKQVRKRKIKVIFHYSKGLMCCSCCGESEIEFLTIDHPNNDGAKHRKEIGGGNRFYSWVIKNSFPKGFRVLCMNCNFARGRFGKCPHENYKLF